ncbi:SAM-dependent methyltransferase [Saccharopolyspora sp. NPDC000995]
MWRSEKLAVMANPAAQTATGPMAIVAADQYEDVPLVRDKTVYRLLPTGTKVLVALTWLRPVRRWMVAVNRKFPGLGASMLCRKRFIDDHLNAAVESGLDAVMVLGAGWDTRAHRLPFGHGIPVYEVDLPENIKRKRAALERLYGRAPDQVTLEPTDFETADLANVLADHGFRGDGKTFFVWEAVTQHLTEAGVRATFDFLATRSDSSWHSRTCARISSTACPSTELKGRIAGSCSSAGCGTSGSSRESAGLPRRVRLAARRACRPSRVPRALSGTERT